MKALPIIIAILLHLPVHANLAQNLNNCNQNLEKAVSNYEAFQARFLTESRSTENLQANFEALNKKVDAHFAYTRTYLEDSKKIANKDIPAKLIELDSYNNDLFVRLQNLSSENDKFLTLINLSQSEVKSLLDAIEVSKGACDRDGREFLENLSTSLRELDTRLADFKNMSARTSIISHNLFAYTKEYLKLELARKSDASALEKASSLSIAINEILKNKSYDLMNNIYYGFYHDPDHYNKTRSQKCLLQRSIDMLSQASHEFKTIGLGIDGAKFPELFKQYQTLQSSFGKMEQSFSKNWKVTLACQQKNIVKIQNCKSEIANYQTLPKTTLSEFLVADKLYTQIYDKCVGGAK